VTVVVIAASITLSRNLTPLASRFTRTHGIALTFTRNLALTRNLAFTFDGAFAGDLTIARFLASFAPRFSALVPNHWRRDVDLARLCRGGGHWCECQHRGQADGNN
jgi:hypothetical protein